jgi:hypothetical protein
VTPNEMRAKALECEHKARATPRSGGDTHDTELATDGRELADQIDGNKR